MRRLHLIRSRIVIILRPSIFAFRTSSLTRLSIPFIFNSAESSIVTSLSSGGINSERAFKNVVFPAPVPPEIKMLYPAFTSIPKNSAVFLSIAPSSIKFSIPIISHGNFLIVTAAPSTDTPFKTMFTLDPSSSIKSTIGLVSLTILFAPPTICCITLISLSLLSNCFVVLYILPAFS